MNKCPESFRNYLKEQIKSHKKILLKLSKWINDSFTSITAINRFLQNFQDKKDFYNNINKLFKLYHENILYLFDSNCS